VSVCRCFPIYVPTHAFAPIATSTQDARALYSAQHAEKSTSALIAPFSISDTTITDTRTEAKAKKEHPRSRQKNKKSNTTTRNDGEPALRTSGQQSEVISAWKQVGGDLDQAQFAIKETDEGSMAIGDGALGENSNDLYIFVALMYHSEPGVQAASSLSLPLLGHAGTILFCLIKSSLMHHSRTAVPATASLQLPTLSLESDRAHSNARLEADTFWTTTHLDLRSIPRLTVQYTSSLGNAPVGDTSAPLLQPEHNGHSQSHLLSDIHISIPNTNAAQITIPFDRNQEQELCPGWFDMNHMVDDEAMSSQSHSNFPMFDISNERSCVNDHSFMSDFSNSSNLAFNFDSFQDSTQDRQTNNGPYKFTFNAHAGQPFVGNASYSVNGDGQTLGYGIASQNQSDSFVSEPGTVRSTMEPPIHALFAVLPPTQPSLVPTPVGIPQTPVVSPSTTQTPVVTPSNSQVPVATQSPTQAPGVTTPSVTQIPVGAPSIGHGPVAVQPPTQDPAAMSPIAQTPFAAPSTTQTPIIVPQAAQIPVSALPKPRKKGPGRLTSNIGALSQSLLSNETASITTLTPSIPSPTAENQPGISTSSLTSSLPLRPAENQPTEEVRRSGRPVVPSKHSEVVPITSKTIPISQNEKENIPPCTPPDWAVQARNHLLVRDMGEEWQKCVDVWSKLEGKLGYGCLTGTKVMHYLLLVIISDCCFS